MDGRLLCIDSFSWRWMDIVWGRSVDGVGQWTRADEHR